ncbi:MAG: hypothetical protein P8R31_11685 [Mariniblastus sp.]|nr:hypothetical protein [Mariniblastus sp.]
MDFTKSATILEQSAGGTELLASTQPMYLIGSTDRCGQASVLNYEEFFNENNDE